MLVFMISLVKSTCCAISPYEFVVFGLNCFILTYGNSFNFDEPLGVVVIWNVLLRHRINEAKHEREIGLRQLNLVQGVQIL